MHFWSKMKKTRMDSDRKWKVCFIKVPLFLLKNACGASYKPFYIFFVVPLRGHFSIGILTKTKKWKVKCLYFCELQKELHVHNTFLTFSIFQPILVGTCNKSGKSFVTRLQCSQKGFWFGRKFLRFGKKFLILMVYNTKYT